jgi:glycosyltransferase involved in cell wall biosynthesis
MKKMILLYGKMSKEHNDKQQRMIDGGCTCGYRPYAEHYGDIIYLCPQEVRHPWEHSMTNPKDVIAFIRQRPDAVVWSIKHDPQKDKHILQHIDNRKLYYSCNAYNCYNLFCDVSLVDSEARMGKNSRLHLKGKNPDYWKPQCEKEYDYLLMGRRADKNELYFLERLNEVNEPRRILWIGGEGHKDKIKCKHEVVCTGFTGPDEVSKDISKARVGILFTEHPAEGFPQSLLEMSMCGVPVVYNANAPRNDQYFGDENTILITYKKNLIKGAEQLLANHDAEACRQFAIDNFSLQKSHERLTSL